MRIVDLLMYFSANQWWETNSYYKRIKFYIVSVILCICFTYLLTDACIGACVCGFWIDPGSSLGRMRLLTEQGAELLNKQLSLESELQKQNTLQRELQERTKSASLRPDELSSQQLSTLFRESHCLVFDSF